MATYPVWVNASTTVAVQKNVPIWPEGFGNIGVDPGKICEQSDVDNYLVPSLNASGFTCVAGSEVDDYSRPGVYPVTWDTETRRGWYLPVAGIQPPNIPWPINVECSKLLPLMMVKGVGAPGYWTFDPNNIFALMSSYGLTWRPL